eukprot:jgi/Mesen1/5334/ME000266S04518
MDWTSLHIVERNPVRRFGQWVDHGLMVLFGALANFVVRRPYKVILGCILFAIVCTAGLLRINYVVDREKLFTPQGNQAFQDRVFATGRGGPGTTNLLTTDALLAFLDLYENLRTFNATRNGRQYSLEDPAVCYRPGGPTAPCDVVSVLDYWRYSRAAIEADTDILRTVNNASAVDLLGRSISQELVMGGVVRGGGGLIESAAAFQLRLSLQNNKGATGSSKRDKITDRWQEDAQPVVEHYHASGAALRALILNTWNANEVSNRTVANDISILVLGYVLLLVYGHIVLAKRHPVESRAILALANIASIGLAVVATYGLGALFGVDFNQVVQVLALLLLGLGTDDMLVTIAAHQETGLEMPHAVLGERVRATVVRARRGVMVASLTNFVAFITGTSSPIPVLREFMIYAAIGVVAVLFFQSTFFVACLVLDMRRQRASKLDMLPCIASSAGPADGCCGRRFDPKTPSITQRIIGQCLPAVILHPVGKVAVLVATAVLCVGGAVGSTRVVSNWNDTWFVPSGTYVREAMDARDQYFPVSSTGALPFSVYTRNGSAAAQPPPLDYFLYQDELAALAAALKANPYVSSSPGVQAWYPSFLSWLPSSIYFVNLTARGRPATSQQFYASLSDYLATSDGSRFQRSIIFANGTAGNERRIVSSEYQATFVYLKDTDVQVDAMRSVRSTATSATPTLGALAYAPYFIFYEGYAVIEKNTIKEVVIAASVVFVIVLVLVADVVAAITVGLMVAMIDVELVGFMHWAGLSFNMATSINLLLGIGIAVDYSAFTAFSFMMQTGSRNERARKALRSFGVAVFNGGFTMFLAVLPMAAAASFIFQTFFQMFSMIVLLGLWHGLCVLPVLLSLFGARPLQSAVEQEQLQEKQKLQQLQAMLGSRVTDAPSMDSPGNHAPGIPSMQ